MSSVALPSGNIIGDARVFLHQRVGVISLFSPLCLRDFYDRLFYHAVLAAFFCLMKCKWAVGAFIVVKK